MQKSILTLFGLFCGTFFGTIGYSCLVSMTIVKDNDMHGWMLYAMPMGAIFGFLTASAIACHVTQDYQPACVLSLLTAIFFG